MSAFDGLDFTKDEVAQALIDYASALGADVPQNYKKVDVRTLGARVRRDTGCILRLAPKSDTDTGDQTDDK